MKKLSLVYMGLAGCGPLVGWLIHRAVLGGETDLLGLVVLIAWSCAWVLMSFYAGQADD